MHTSYLFHVVYIDKNIHIYFIYTCSLLLPLVICANMLTSHANYCTNSVILFHCSLLCRWYYLGTWSMGQWSMGAGITFTHSARNLGSPGQFSQFATVLGLARTGLIFTRIQEGAQPGGLTHPQPGQTEAGIPYHVLSCWVPVGGGAEGTRGSGGLSGGAVWENVMRFVSCFPLICIVVVPVPSVCCSVKLPLSQPTSFLPVSSHSPLHPSGGRGGRVALLLPAAAQTRTFNWCPSVGRV